MFSGFKLGRIFGIEIDISYSWFFIFALVTVLLTFGIFPQTYPGHSVAVNIFLGMITSALFFGSLLFHEMSHSFVANLNRIPIKKITLFVFGGMAQMSSEPEEPKAEFKMAIAGPLSSFFLAGLFYGIYRTMLVLGAPSEFYAPFSWLWEINLLLALFNLAPGFPLDGGRVFRSILWMTTNNLDKATNIASKAGQGLAFILMGMGLLLFVGGNIGGIWFVLIGWFLYQSATASYQQLLLEHTLSDVQVKEIMSVDVKTVSSDTFLDDLVDNYFLKHRYGRFPVTDNGDLIGIVTLHDIKEVKRDRWPTTTTREVVEALEEPMYVNKEDQAVKALIKMAQEDIGHLLVIDDNRHLEGIITRADIIRLIKVKSELAA